jgi:lysozyme family protein
MSDFRTSVLKTLAHEGGYVNNSNDSGGATNFGITQKDLPGQDMQLLTEDQAVQYYADHYFKSLYSQIDSQLITDKLFDMGVLFGVGTAIGILQLCLGVTHDGVFGPGTLAAVNQADETSLLLGYKTNLVTHAFNIAIAHPQDRVFIKGWTTRINS